MRRIRVQVRTPSTDHGPATTYVHMTVLAVRDAPRERRTGSRFGRRHAHMQEIVDRLERDEYVVDPEKVADAIVRRLLAGEGLDTDQCS
jgi:hypothetical protein